MASKTFRQGWEFTRLGQYCVIIKNSLCHGKQNIVSGTRSYTFRIVVCCNKEYTMAWQARHCITDERLHVQDSSVL